MLRNWDAIGAIGETVAAAGVIISLVSLAAQIRLNTKTLKSGALQTVMREHESNTELLSRPDIADVVHRGVIAFDSLTGSEKFSSMHTGLNTFRHSSSAVTFIVPVT